ncbi:hypothetical protein FHY55_06965 [Oceanicola sp. D3]|uniref:hypothetical protein n=1 Tax=Oceanicola sp. D3 TaxID=2587163 RepID=UPI00111E844C|nr:hypothetical protein [Oceanicola sp. D3]QDC08999.1 hypothetical protein FHY55_06965 [Oceanicola sp. D3]
MTPGLRALLAHAVGFATGVFVAWAILNLAGRGVAPDGKTGAGLALLAGMALVCGLAGLAAWTMIVTRMTGLTAGRDWWIRGIGAVVGMMVLACGLMLAGIFAPSEALVLMLFLLFALGGWATHGQVTNT